MMMKKSQRRREIIVTFKKWTEFPAIGWADLPPSVSVADSIHESVLRTLTLELSIEP